DEGRGITTRHAGPSTRSSAPEPRRFWLSVRSRRGARRRDPFAGSRARWALRAAPSGPVVKLGRSKVNGAPVESAARAITEVESMTAVPNERNEEGGEPRANWRANRRRNRALGIDRYGRPLPRVAGTNPRALGTNPRANRSGVKWWTQW